MGRPFDPDAAPTTPTAIPSVPQAAPILVESFVSAFNAHDAEQLAALFTEDGWFVDVVGHRLHGREQIRRAHAYAFRGPLEHAHLDPVEVTGKHIAPDVVHVEVTWRSTGHTGTQVDGAEDLPPERRGLLLLTLARQSPSHRWVVAAGANQDFTHTYTGDESAFTDTMAAE